MLTQQSLRIDQTTYLGPAKILALEGNRVQLETPDAYPWATPALAHWYQPVVGDEVLAAGKGNDWYIIGVLRGAGTVRLTAPGDIEFHAPNGDIRLESSGGVKVAGGHVEIEARTVEVRAGTLLQRATDLFSWAQRSLSFRADRMDADVAGSSTLRAGEIDHRAEGDVVIDGKTIHLA